MPIRSWLRELFASRTPRTIRKVPARARLAVESLEDRVVLNNTAPTILCIQPALTVNEGSLATTSGTFDDAQGRNTVALTASLGTVTKDDAAGTWSWSYTPPDNTSGPTPVTITATDGGGLTAKASFTLTAPNVAPTITAFTVPASPAEGTYLSAAAADPAGANDPLTYTWALTRPDGELVLKTSSFSPRFYLAKDGSYPVRPTANDGDGGTATPSADVSLANVAPTITAFTVPATAAEGSAASLSAAATDPAGANDPLSYTWTVTRPD